MTSRLEIYNSKGILQTGATGGTGSTNVILRPDSSTRNLIYPTDASFPNLILKLFTAQTADLLQFRTAADVIIAAVQASGQMILGGSAADASALLDLVSTTKGMLAPRMTGAQRDLIGTPATGLFLFNTSTGLYNFHNGSAWKALQIQNAHLDAIAALSPASGNFLRYNGSAWAAAALLAGDIPDLSGTYQPLNAALTAISGMAHTDKYAIISNGSVWQARALTVADISDIASNYQPLDADLTAVAAISAGDGYIKRASGVWSPTTTIPASDIALSKLAGSTYGTLQEMQNLVHSTGWVAGGDVTNNGNGTVAVSAGQGLIRATNSNTAALYFCDWAANATVALTNFSENWIVVQYNAGTPTIAVVTTEPTDFNTNIVLCRIYRNNNDLHIFIGARHTIGDHASLMMRSMAETMPFSNVSGGRVSATGTRKFAITAGVWWHGLTRFTTAAFDSNGAGTFNYYYRNGSGGWTETSSNTQINNTQYDNNSGTLATLTNNKYGVHWIYLAADGDVSVVFGQGDYTLTEAQNADMPTPPPELATDSRLIGKVIIQKSAAAFTSIETVLGMALTAAPVADHNSLVGLQGGTAAEYYHLTSAQHTDLTDGGETTLHKHAEFGASGANHAPGIVPDPGATAGTTKYLREDKTWAVPAGGGAGGAAIPIGTIMPYGATGSLPTGWLECDGSAVSRSTYADLFAVLGTTWGAGDGGSTFNLPNLKGRAPIGSGQGSGLTNRTLAGAGGEETHQLTTTEMPAHTHSDTQPVSRNDTNPGYGATTGWNYGYNIGSSSNLPTGSAGSDGAHNNMQPFVVVRYIINYLAIATGAADGVTINQTSAAQAILKHKVNGDGGNTTNNAGWHTVPYNLEDQDTGNYVSLDTGTGEFTLLAGSHTIELWHDFYSSGYVNIRLFNVTDNQLVEEGGGTYTGSGVSARLRMTVPITIAATKTLRVEYQCSVSQSATGLGIDPNYQDTVFGEIKITTSLNAVYNQNVYVLEGNGGGLRGSGHATDPFADCTAATHIYLHPMGDGRISVVSGGNLVWRTVSSPIDVNLASVATSTNKVYDLWVYDNSGTLAAEVLAWTNDTTRATAIVWNTTINAWVKSGDSSRRLVLTFRTTSAGGAVTCNAGIRNIQNVENQIAMPIYALTSTEGAYYSGTQASWTNVNGTADGTDRFVWVQATTRLCVYARWEIDVYGVYAPYYGFYGLSVDGSTPPTMYHGHAAGATAMYWSTSMILKQSAPSVGWHTAQKQAYSAGSTWAVYDFAIQGTFWG